MKARKIHWISILALGFLLGCNSDPVDVEDPLPDADMRVLFIGNSLTYTNRLPEMVQTIAEASGHTLAQGMVAAPNVSLEDHWLSGVERTINSVKADVVVMQQGPSSLPQNQEYLRFWTERMSESIRQAGGVPALYMVWPEATRAYAFDAVYESYLGAATAVNGLFMPAGLAWLYAWQQDPELELYGPDGFHPTPLGSAVAALTIYRILFNEDVTDLPSRMVPQSSGLPVIDLGLNADAVFLAVELAASTVGGGASTVGVGAAKVVN